MNRIASLLSIVAVLIAPPTFGDELSDLEEQLKLLQMRIKVAEERKKLTDLQVKLAKDQENTAKSLAEKAKQELIAIIESQKAGISAISIERAELYSTFDQSKVCDAKPFLEFTCNMENNCKFDVNAAQKICRLPASEAEPMILTVGYKCGDIGKVVNFPFGGPGHLTCK